MENKFFLKLCSLNNRENRCVLGCTLIFLSLIAVIFYIFGGARSEMHADCIDTLMWANASYTSGSLFNKGFGYACLLPFGGQLLMLPFICIFGFSYSAHTAGMVLFALIFISSLVFMFKNMGLSLFKTGLSVFSFVMFTFASAKLREIFWGHIIYYSLGLMFLFVGMGLALKILKGKKAFIPIILIFIWTALCATDGIQALTIYILPLCAGLLGFIVFNFDRKLFDKGNINTAFTACIILLAAVFGRVIMGFASKGIAQGYADAYSMFGKTTDWFDNLSKLLKSHYTLLGVSVNGKMPIMSYDGVLNILRIIFATVVAAAPFFGIVYYTRLKNAAVKLFVIVHFTAVFLIMIGWVFGKISGANWRLVPIEATGLILTVLLFYELCSAGIYSRLGNILTIPVIIYCFISVINLFSIPIGFSNNVLYDELSLLEKNGCTYGYATFWYANPITAITDNKIKVRGVKIEDDGIAYRSYQSDKSWYDGVTKPDETYFILLDYDEYENFNADKYPVESIIIDKGFALIILDENIDLLKK